MDLKRLRELAEKATPGPWEYRETDGSAAVCHLSGWVEAILPSGTQENADAAYCAAANPATVLALLDAAKNYGLDADHARQERDAWIAENSRGGWIDDLRVKNEALSIELETLRALLRDIVTESLIPDEYPLLMARARAALDGGGV